MSNKVIRLDLYATGFRGDWKALKQVFNFNRYADRDEDRVVKMSICSPIVRIVRFF